MMEVGNSVDWLDMMKHNERIEDVDLILAIYLLITVKIIGPRKVSVD